MNRVLEHPQITYCSCLAAVFLARRGWARAKQVESPSRRVAADSEADYTKAINDKKMGRGIAGQSQLVGEAAEKPPTRHQMGQWVHGDEKEENNLALFSLQIHFRTKQKKTSEDYNAGTLSF